MDRSSTVCMRCGEIMEEGFLVDFGDNDSPYPSRWVAGKPEKLKLGGAAWSDRPCHGVEVWRCIGCGSLDFFANAEPWPKPDQH